MKRKLRAHILHTVRTKDASTSVAEAGVLANPTDELAVAVGRGIAALRERTADQRVSREQDRYALAENGFDRSHASDLGMDGGTRAGTARGRVIVRAIPPVQESLWETLRFSRGLIISFCP